MRFLLPVLAATVFITGCKTASLPSGPKGDTRTTAARPLMADVTLEGTSIMGAWYAVEVVGDRRATRDLEEGTMEQTLIVSSNGRAALTGIDRREGDGPVTFNGRILGNRITFDGMEGAGTLLMTGSRLSLLDPRGRTTIFVRGR